MVQRIEKTVFVSYRRTNMPWALAIYKDLSANGFDVFFDYDSIKSGDFEQVIVQNIKGRAHFVVILTPSALERCDEPGDWLRREIELALDEKRNIVPLFLEGFSFNSPSVSKYLTGKLSLLKKYNGLNVPSDYFDEALGRLRSKYLDIPLDTVLHPVSDKIQNESAKQKKIADDAKQVDEAELVAQEWFEKGNKFFMEDNFEEAIYCYIESIQFKPNFSEAYNNRGFAWLKKGDFDQAISDTTKSISLNQELTPSYSVRGKAQYFKGDFDGAIRDFTKLIEKLLESNNRSNLGEAFFDRGISRFRKDDYSSAIKDFTEAIHLRPDNVEAYFNRGSAFILINDYDGAIKDLTETIRLNPNFAKAYMARGSAYGIKKDYSNGIKDFDKAIQLDPLNSYAYSSRGQQRILSGDLLGGGLDIAKGKTIGK